MANVEQGKPVTLEEIYLEYCTAESLASRRSDSSLVRKFGPVATAQTVEECVTDTQHIHAFNMFAWATLGEFHQLVEKSCRAPARITASHDAPPDSADEHFALSPSWEELEAAAEFQ